MIRINLLPTKEKAAAASQRQELTLAGLGILLVVGICLLLTVSLQREDSRLDAETVRLERSLQELEDKVKSVADLDRKRKDLDSKLEVIALLSRKRVGPAELLKDLGRAIPDRSWLTQFSEVGNGGTLEGQAVDNQTIAEFLRSLEASEYFTKADLVETTQTTTNQGIKLRKFILNMSVDYAAGGKGTEEDAK